MPPITPNSTSNAIPNLVSIAKHISKVTGLAVFPTGLDKIPQVRRADKENGEVGGYRLSSAVPEDVDKLFSAGEARNATGYGFVPDGLIVALDFDTDKAGWQDALDYTRDTIQGSGFPLHLETVTPRGGIHLFVEVADEAARAALGSVIYWKGQPVGDARHDSNGYFVEGGSKARVKGTGEVKEYTFQIWTGGAEGSAELIGVEGVTADLWSRNATWNLTHLKPLTGKVVSLISVNGETLKGAGNKASLDITVGGTPVDKGKLTAAVMHLARKGIMDSYDGWMRIGSAIKNTCDDGLFEAGGGDLGGLELFLAASRLARGFEGDEQAVTKWHQLGGRGRGDDRVGVGSIFYEAAESGWKDKAKTLKEMLAAAGEGFAKMQAAGLTGVGGGGVGGVGGTVVSPAPPQSKLTKAMKVPDNSDGEADDEANTGDILYTDEWADWEGDDGHLPITTQAREQAKSAIEEQGDQESAAGESDETDNPVMAVDREAAMGFLLSRDLLSPTPGSPEDMKDMVRHCDLMGDIVFSEMSNYMFNRRTGMLDKLDVSAVSSGAMARSVRRLAHAIEAVDTDHGTWNGIKRDAGWIAAATAPLRDAKGVIVKDPKTGKDKVPVPPCAQRCAISQTKDFESYMKIAMTTGQARVSDAEVQQRRGVIAFECGNVLEVKVARPKGESKGPLGLGNIRLIVRPITRDDKVSGKMRGTAARTRDLMELYISNEGARARAQGESLWFNSCVFLCFHSDVGVATWLAGEIFGSLMGYPDCTKSVFITGTSQAGKGTFLQTCAKIVRGPATFEIDAGALYREKENMALLAPSLARGLCGFVTELSEDDGIHLSRFKRLHGRDSIGILREMYSPRTFSIHNKAQYFVGANEIPAFKGAASDIAPIRSRLLMVNVYNDRPLAERDVEYGDKMLSQDTLAPLGILWGIERELAKKNGLYGVPTLVKEAVGEEVTNTNPLAAYFASCPKGKGLTYSRTKFLKDVHKYAVDEGMREANAFMGADKYDPLSAVCVAKYVKRETHGKNNLTTTEARKRTGSGVQEAHWFGFGEPK